jgi:hypothetical protein
VLGPIVFAIFANPGFAAFFDEKFESAPLQQRVRPSVPLAISWPRWRGTPPVKAMAESLAVFAAEAKKWPADAAHKWKVFCAVGELRLPSLHCSAVARGKGALGG